MYYGGRCEFRRYMRSRASLTESSAGKTSTQCCTCETTLQYYLLSHDAMHNADHAAQDICLSVRLPRSGIVSKRLNTLSIFLHRLVAAYGRTNGPMLCPSVCLSVVCDVCIVANGASYQINSLKQQIENGIWHMGNRIVTSPMTSIRLGHNISKQHSEIPTVCTWRGR